MVAGVSRARFCPGRGRQPRLEPLDVRAPDVAHPVQLRVLIGQVGRQRAQREVGATDAARAQHARDLIQVGAHRGHHLRVGDLQVAPGGQQQRPAHRSLRKPGIGARCVGGGGGLPVGAPAKTWASMTSAARRY